MKRQLFILLAFAAATCATACIKQERAEEPAGGWKVSVYAVKGSGTKALAYDDVNMKILTSFKTTDEVYVYNKTKGALDESVLKPQADGETATLRGSLTGDYAVGDVLELRYGSYFTGHDGVFDYEEQDGTFATVRDFAIATVSVTATDSANGILTLQDASFANPNSIFRFSFVDMDTHNPIPISFLWIKAPQGKLVFRDLPDGTREYYGDLPSSFPRESYRGDSSDPVWLALCYEAPETDPELDGFLFDIIDDVNKIVYNAYKPTSGKIANGNFYAPTIEMMPLPKPAVTLTESGTPVEPTELNALSYFGNYYTYINPGADITVAGDGDQCRFRWDTGGDATMHLNGGTDDAPQFLVCPDRAFIEHLRSGVLTLDLNGSSWIVGEADNALIKVDFTSAEVVFKGNGSLTVVASNTAGDKGIMTADAAGNPRDGVLNVHAAEGFVLEITGGTDNGNGTSTWTYTVREDVNQPTGSIHDFEYVDNAWED